MKRLFIAAIAIILGCTAVSAQKKGDKYIGGMAGVAIQVGGGGVAAGAAIQPEFGGFVADRCRLGVSVGYAISEGMHTITAAPNFAYYVRLCEGVYYTPGIEAGLVMAISGGAYPGVGIALNLFPLEFRPTEHFGFSANLISLNFVGIKRAGSALQFDMGVNPSFGVKYYF